MLADYHMHTEFSDDSTCPMEKAIQTAIAKNLDEICFTEHIDYGVKTDLNCDCQKYLEKFTTGLKIFINLKLCLLCHLHIFRLITN